MKTEELASDIYNLGAKRSYYWCMGKAEKLKEAAVKNPFKETLYKNQPFEVSSLLV
ncbi:hypothetical protein LIT32_26655 (plasmid) [Bacillus sp. CMF21]|nr:hypothetical protein LIT32_26655 [Bacillus sp. CMF21]